MGTVLCSSFIMDQLDSSLLNAHMHKHDNLLLICFCTHRIVGPSVIMAHIQHGWVSSNTITC